MNMQLSLFPNNLKMFEDLYHFYDLNKPVAFSLLTIVFIIRTTFLVSTGGGSAEFGELFRDLLFTAIAIVGFTSFLQIIGQIPDFLISEISSKSIPEPTPSSEWAPWFVDKMIMVTDLFAILVSVVVALVYMLLMGVATMLGPFILLLSIMGKQSWLLKTLVTALVLTSLWPVFWYLINFFLHHMMLTSDWFMGTCMFLLGTLAKIGVPIAVMKGLAQLSGVTSAAKSGKTTIAETARQTHNLTRAASSVTTMLGGGHYVQGLNRGIDAGKNLVMNSSSNLASQIIPSMEKMGAVTGQTLGRAISKVTPDPIKSRVSNMAGQTKSISSKIAKKFNGPNQESFSLGSPVQGKSNQQQFQPSLKHQSGGLKGFSQNALRSENKFNGNKASVSMQSSPEIENHRAFALGSPMPKSADSPMTVFENDKVQTKTTAPQALSESGSIESL